MTVRISVLLLCMYESVCVCRVSQFANKNLMTVPNLGVCFGPTLLRPPEETMAAIMDIKWCNIVIELLIYNYEKVSARTVRVVVTRDWSVKFMLVYVFVDVAVTFLNRL